MALLKSKAAKAAAMADATRLLASAPAADSSFDVSTTPGSTADWSISQLSAIYKEHRTQLVSQARRITRDEAEANEVVQEAFLKFMLASPELDTSDRAIAYLRTSVTNLSLNVIRARGARPNLVAIDADTTQDAGDMIIGGIADGNPVVYIEHRWLHGIKSEVSQPFQSYKIGTARISKPGKDYTIVANSYAVVDSLLAARFLESKGISCEVIDMRSILPWDKDLILKSIARTKRVLIVDTGHKSFGITGEIISTIVEELWGQLDLKPLRIGFPDIPVPSAPGLSKNYYPGPEEIAIEISNSLGLVLSTEEIHELRGDGPYDIPRQGLVGPF